MVNAAAMYFPVPPKRYRNQLTATAMTLAQLGAAARFQARLGTGRKSRHGDSPGDRM